MGALRRPSAPIPAFPRRGKEKFGGAHPRVLTNSQGAVT